MSAEVPLLLLLLGVAAALGGAGEADEGGVGVVAGAPNENVGEEADETGLVAAPNPPNDENGFAFGGPAAAAPKLKEGAAAGEAGLELPAEAANGFAAALGLLEGVVPGRPLRLGSPRITLPSVGVEGSMGDWDDGDSSSEPPSPSSRRICLSACRFIVQGKYKVGKERNRLSFVIIVSFLLERRI